MFRPWQAEEWRTRRTDSGWFHVDQGRSLRGLQCVQGLVTLTDVSEDTGGFCCIPKSQKYHDELMDKHARDDHNYLRVPCDFHGLKDAQGMPCCQAGDMVLWDSRTIHCSTPALKQPLSASLTSPLRLASYVCMTPTAAASSAALAKRVEMFRGDQTGTHWPHLLPLNSPQAGAAGVERSGRDLRELSREELSLLIGESNNLCSFL